MGRNKKTKNKTKKQKKKRKTNKTKNKQTNNEQQTNKTKQNKKTVFFRENLPGSIRPFPGPVVCDAVQWEAAYDRGRG